MKKKLRLVVAIGMTLGSLASVQGQSFLTNGLVAYYPFNGNANDESGSGRNGTIVGAVLITNRFGKTSAAMDFNGTSRVGVPLNYGFTNNAATISVWFLTRIVNQTGTPQSYLCDFRTGATTGAALFANVDATLVQTFAASVNTSPAFTTNVWYHFLATYTNGTTQIYINGVRRHTVSNSFITIGQATTGYFGTRYNLQESLNGLMDDVRIYNRILSSNEVALLYYYEAKPNVRFVKMYSLDFDSLTLGSNYQLQVSTDLFSWTNWGSIFTATSDKYANAVPVQRVDDWDKIFFRLDPR